MPISGGSAIAPQQVWDILAASQTGVGSLGKLLLDNVDLKLSDYLGKASRFEASDVIQLASDGAVEVTEGVYTIKKEIQVYMAGTVRTSYKYRAQGTSAWEYNKIYINGAPVGVERKTQSGSYVQAPGEDFPVDIDDLVQLYCYQDGAVTGAVLEFRAKFDVVTAVGKVII